ncbi:MAG: hypothetical protein HY782_19570 [Chloroflexi bacterium]|nr:hypothetical protein [Chloroflexota bacterium]
MLDERFERAEREFFKFKGQLDAGRITPEQFDAALKELIVEDSHGRFWMLGADTGKWYTHDGEAWVEGTPPSAEPPGVVGDGGSTVAHAAPPPKTQSETSRRFLALLGTAAAGLLTLLVGLGVTWGQGALRGAFLGSAVTPTRLVANAPTLTNTPVIIVTTSTPTTTPSPTETLAPAATPPSTLAATAIPLPSSTPVPPTAQPQVSALTAPTPANPPPPIVIVITATPLPPPPAPTRTNTATRTLTSVPTNTRTLTATNVAASRTPTIAPVPTFPASVVTWSTGFDQAASKPTGIVTNKTFDPRPREIYATWSPTGLPAGTKLDITWTYNGGLWAQGSYVLKTTDTLVWHSTYRQDGQRLASGDYRVEVRVGSQLILADQVVVN